MLYTSFFVTLLGLTAVQAVPAVKPSERDVIPVGRTFTPQPTAAELKVITESLELGIVNSLTATVSLPTYLVVVLLTRKPDHRRNLDYGTGIVSVSSGYVDACSHPDDVFIPISASFIGTLRTIRMVRAFFHAALNQQRTLSPLISLF